MKMDFQAAPLALARTESLAPRPARRPAPKRGTRPLEPDDIERIAEIFLHVFRGSARKPSPALVEYFENVYLKGPFQATPLESRVSVRADGRVDGFAGVVPLQLQIGDRPARANALGTVMVEDRKISPRAGVSMVLSIFAGPHELSFTDTANQTSFAIGRALKMDLQVQHSLEWIKVFHPVRLAAHLASRRWRPLPRSLANGCAALFDPFVERFAPKDDVRRLATAHDSPMTRDAFIAAAPAFVARYKLRPQWSAPELGWLIDLAAQKSANGDLRLRAVSDAKGNLIGCYAMYAASNSVAYVLQILGTAKSCELVLASAIVHAQSIGCHAVRGFSQPQLMASLYRVPGILFRHNAATLTRSRDPEIVSAIHSGEAFLGGFVGESWTRLVADVF